MKNSLLLVFRKSFLLVGITAMFFFMSCAKKMSFGISAVVPAAEGNVKVNRDKNRNYTVDLTIDRLSEPSRLTPPKSNYVVWMQTQSNGIRNLGNLTTSSGLFSSSLKDSLHTATPFKPISFLVTAEDNATPPTPRGVVVLQTR